MVLAAFPVVVAAAALWASYDVWRPTGDLRGLAGRHMYPVVTPLAIGLVAAIAALLRRLRSVRTKRAMLALGIAAFAVAGTGESVLRTLTDLYDSTSLSVIAERMVVTAPLEFGPAVLAALAASWFAATIAAVATTIAAARHPRPPRMI